MLTLKNIGKDFVSGHTTIHALRCVNLVCRPRELIMVVGGNGSGKSTLLRILAAQLPASRGEMLIDGRSVRKFSDDEWSGYRRRVGLAAPEELLHDRTLLDNLSLNLCLSGFGPGRREQAMDMLQFFGLGAVANRYPGDLSRAERKLAALACALVSEPDVLLVDEPVLGLDPVNAKKVAGVLHETARHCLVITASRKPVFAESEVRTIRVKDGTIESDSDPCAEGKDPSTRVEKRKSLTIGGRVSLAWKGLWRKAARAPARAFTSFAASFCAGLVLVLSGAIVSHSAAVQQSTLSVYPIHITEETVPSDVLQGLYKDLSARGDLPAGTEILPTYGAVPWIFSLTSDGTARQVNPTGQGENLWAELPDDPDIRRARYQLLNGRWPERYDEVVVIQNTSGNYSSLGLASMGILPDSESGETSIPDFDDFLHTTFRLVLPVQAYYPNADGTWGSLLGDMEYMSTLMGQVPSLKIVGVLCPAENTADTDETVFIGYTRAMTAYITEQILSSPLISAQEASLEVDVLTGLPFDTKGLHQQPAEHKAVAMLDYIITLDDNRRRLLYQEVTGHGMGEGDTIQLAANAVADLPAEEAAALYDKYVASQYSPATYEGNMELFGASSVSCVTELRLYASSLAGRQQLSAQLDSYSDTLTYSDEAEAMVASAASFAAGLKKACILFSAVAVVCAAVAVVVIHGAALGNRMGTWSRLRSRGLRRQQLIGLCLWESVALSLLPSALGVAGAWLLCGPLCHLAGWAPLASHCSQPLWQAAGLTGILFALSVLSAAVTVASLNRVWPGEMLQNGKE